MKQAACRDQMLVLLQKVFCNKSVAADFAFSFPIYIQAAWKNRTCCFKAKSENRVLPKAKSLLAISIRKGVRLHTICELYTLSTKISTTTKLKEEKIKHKITFTTWLLCTGN